MRNAINWFEIPAKNFERAVEFYNQIFETPMHKQEMMGYNMAFFEAEKGVGGAVIQGQGYEPSDKGVLVYLNGGDDLSVPLSKVEKAGGKVLVPKTLIKEEIGYFAIFMYTEGNKVAIHSLK